MTSPSREAFESALTRAIKEQQDPRFYSTIDAINWAWQAAIQHARDVAVKACKDVEKHAVSFRGSSHDDYHEGREDGAAKCVDAIKEALK